MAQDIEWTKKSSGWVATISYSQSSDQLQELRIRDFLGDIDLIGTDQGDAVVVVEFNSNEMNRERAEKHFEQVRPEFSQTANGLLIETPQKRRWFLNIDYNFELEAHLPKTCRIDAGTMGGDVSATAFTADVDIATSGGDLDVTDIFGDVDLATSGGDIDLAKITGDVSASTSGGDIEIATIKGNVEVATSGGEIEAEDVIGDLEASTSGGDVLVRHLKVEHLDLATSGGDMEGIDVEVDRGAEFTTSGGDVILHDCTGEFELATHGGDLEATDHKGMLVLTTSAGDISVEELNGGISAKVGHGSIDVSVAKNASTEFRAFELNTGNGDITLVLPADFKAFIEATVSNAWDDDDSIISDFPLKITQLGRNGFQATGDLNGGGLPIELISSGGEIEIRKR